MNPENHPSSCRVNTEAAELKQEQPEKARRMHGKRLQMGLSAAACRCNRGGDLHAVPARPNQMLRTRPSPPSTHRHTASTSNAEVSLLPRPHGLRGGKHSTPLLLVKPRLRGGSCFISTDGFFPHSMRINQPIEVHHFTTTSAVQKGFTPNKPMSRQTGKPCQ